MIAMVMPANDPITHSRGTRYPKIEYFPSPHVQQLHEMHSHFGEHLQQSHDGHLQLADFNSFGFLLDISNS